LFKIFIIARDGKEREELYLSLAQKGYGCSIDRNEEEVVNEIAEQDPALVLVASNSHSYISGLAREIKQIRSLPIIALIEREMLTDVDGHMNLIDDFVVQPYDLRELNLRVKRLLHKTEQMNSGELITCGELLINLAKCEVTLAGEQIELTFLEYELLKFLAGNKGRVFTRDVLLNKVWGYDYYGGDRTVDVHIRRLRSKIEDSKHNFIETVRSIGYRFKEDMDRAFR
jgi:DNA-binding response OmpR family regulator